MPGGHSGKEPHAIIERKATLAGVALDLLPVVERFSQLFAVDFDPLPFECDQAANGLEKLFELGLGERLAVERHVHGKIEQGIHAERSALAGIDRDVDRGPRRAARFPPVGDPDDQAALLEDRNVLQEPIRLARAPGQGMIDFARVDHLLDERAALGRALDRHQEREERGPVFRPGVFLQSLAQGLVLHATLGRELGNISRQECEGVLRVALVLSEVKRHAADEPPLGIALAQVCLRASRMVRDLVANKRVELRPPAREHVGAEVFTPLHRRRLENLERQVRRGWRRYGRDRAACCIHRRLAEPGQIQTGEIARIGERRRQAGLELGRRQVQETTRRTFVESDMDSLPGGTIHARAIRSGDFANVEMALWR